MKRVISVLIIIFLINGCMIDWNISIAKAEEQMISDEGFK